MQLWKIIPFKVLGDSTGLMGGVALAANGVVFDQVATPVVERPLVVTDALKLIQSDYWIESASNSLTLTQGLGHNRERPLTVAQSFNVTDSNQTAGGHSHTLIHEIIADGVILAGQAIYIQSTGHAALTQVGNATKASVAGIAMASGGGIISGTLYYMTAGCLTLADWTDAAGTATLSPGAPYYLASTDGLITNMPLINKGEFVVKIGRALNAETLAIELGEGTGL